MATAYLVVNLDTTQCPPVVKGAGIYTRSWSEMTLDHRPSNCYVDALVIEGDTQQEALDAIERAIAYWPQWHWARAWITAGRDGV